MTPQELADAFSKAGIDTVEKIDYFARVINLQSQLRRKELEIDGLSAKRAEILVPLDNERIALTNEKLALITEINALVPPK
jgi:hypothetical protein